MEVIKVDTALMGRFGLLTGMVANLARHRAESVIGAFTLPASWVAKSAGISERSAVSAIQELQAAGFIQHAAGGGDSGKPKQYRLATQTPANFAGVLGGLYRRDFKGVHILQGSTTDAMRLELLGWDLTESDADMVLAEYPAAWVAAKLADCRERRKGAKNPSGYLKAALASIEIESERRKVIDRLKAEAAQLRKAANRDLAEAIAERATMLQGRAKAAAEAEALAWWRGLDEAGKVAVEAEYVSWCPAGMGGGLFGFRPEDSGLSAGWLVQHWGQRAQRLVGMRCTGCDVQADGRLIWLTIATGPAGIALADYGETDEAGKVPNGRKMLVDEGDGNRTAWARAWVGQLRESGVDAATWKGGCCQATGGELVPIASQENAWHANEKHWAGQALRLLAGGKLAIAAHLLDNAQLWRGLASRIDIETAGPDDHPFDALKMALAAAGGIAHV